MEDIKQKLEEIYKLAIKTENLGMALSVTDLLRKTAEKKVQLYNTSLEERIIELENKVEQLLPNVR